jgi:hypothetical protein
MHTLILESYCKALFLMVSAVQITLSLHHWGKQIACSNSMIQGYFAYKVCLRGETTKVSTVIQAKEEIRYPNTRFPHAEKVTWKEAVIIG